MDWDTLLFWFMAVNAAAVWSVAIGCSVVLAVQLALQWMKERSNTREPHD